MEVQLAVREFALALPGAWEDHPWGESVAKVGKKVFAFMGHPDYPPGMSVKLPDSGGFALAQPYAQPTGYGLGKAGWVSISFEGPNAPDLPLALEWVEESYRAIAPKKLVNELDALGR